jgi:N-methylhydantoinase A/oxoprolinase/acetone carboxylase beta subunit
MEEQPFICGDSSPAQLQEGNAVVPAPQPALVLGIDTGGTYTDGVLLDYHSRRVLAFHKSLTTKRDLSIGIEKVIEGIQIEDPSAIRMVSISTTLATNAIAEGKGKRVALLLIGYDPELISSFKMEGRFATPHFHYFEGGHDLYGRQKAGLDLPGILAKVNELRDTVDAIAVSSYFSPLNPEHENRVRQAISSISDLPVVLGHQLSNKLGSVERATTAALNASLLTVLQDFIIAVRRAMERRQIDAPLMVVRGDGTLMSDELAARIPVETIHSGPAASAIGGRFLTGLDNLLVVDVGGTTTDIALIQEGQVTISEQGASVGDYKTAVGAANLLSIALGGDSHITLNREKQIAVGPERVTPLAHLAWEFPVVGKQLQALRHRQWAQATPDWLEYWFLLREPPGDGIIQAPRARELIDYLQDGPKPMPDILKHLKLLHVGQLGARELFRQEILGRSGLTPTDLMHVEGRYDLWDAKASEAALEILAHNQFLEPDDLRQEIWDHINEMIVHAILTFLCEKDLDLSPGHRAAGARRRTEQRISPKDRDLGRWFFYNSIYNSHPLLKTQIRLDLPMIGIGAPARIMLSRAAESLKTDLVLPEHHQVGNAVGAIAGSVMATEELLVYPMLAGAGLDVRGYYCQASDERHEFEELQEALEFARALGRERALGAAIRSGAANPQVGLEQLDDGLDTFRIRAKAMGNPRLAR